jgi:ribosome-binding ATPase
MIMVKIGFLGYTASGKTKIFRELTGKEEESYDPFKPQVAEGEYKDSRIKEIAGILKPEKIIYPRFEFYDFKGFPEGEGFPAGYFKVVQDLDLILLTVRNFGRDTDSEEEAASLKMEMIFHDIEKTEGILENRKKEEKEFSETQQKILKKGLGLLQEDQFLSNLQQTEKNEISGMGFLTLKKFLFLINGAEKKVNLSFPFFQQKGGGFDHEGFYNCMMSRLSLKTFYTVKGEILQAWVVDENLPAKQTAGKIHKDIEKGFIKAAVLSYEAFLDIGSWQKAKQLGALKFLGPNSNIKDGDIVEFYFH